MQVIIGARGEEVCCNLRRVLMGPPTGMAIVGLLREAIPKEKSQNCGLVL